MDLYTLTDQFLPNEVIDEFVSVIWTERYSSTGDVQLVVPDSLANRVKLKEGTFLALRGSKEIMILETQSIDKGLMTITGLGLITFLNQRMAWFRNLDGTDDDNLITDYSIKTRVPGDFISHVVDKMVITPPTYATDLNLDWTLDTIQFLELGETDMSGEVQRMTAAVGPLYDTIATIAEKYKVGVRLYLDYADADSGYVLKFDTYQGVDRSSAQDVNELVRLVPEMDGIADLKEINSIALYKNVAYVYWRSEVTTHYAEPSLPPPEGFARRVMVVTPDDNPPGHKVTVQQDYRYGGGTYTRYEVSEDDLVEFREQNAKDAFANANYIHVVDGQTSSNSEYVYGVHYGLGDVIELEGLTGIISKSRITEYIRSQDKTGEKNYPTISVITPEEDED